VTDAGGRWVVITGGSRGIGAATARLAAARGWHVCVGYLSGEDAAADLVRTIETNGGRAMAVRADTADEGDVERLFAAVDGQPGALGALVNNAGFAVSPQMRVDEMTAARVARTLAVNVTGCFLCAGQAVRRMSTRHGGDGGAIVNVSSAAARLGAPGEYVDYAASKGAIDTMTLGLAKEVAGEGIRVNAVRPGIIETGFHAAAGDPGRVERLAPNVPMQRGGEAGEVAAVILWLLSDEASYVTAALLDVAGGR